jgi:hypothetical protein
MVQESPLPRTGLYDMIARLLCLIALEIVAYSTSVAQGAEVQGVSRNHAVEEKMAEWLAHPSEFGVRPKSVRLKRTYNADLMTYGKIDIALVDYVMPDGTTGRGFVNGGLTWSFLGPEVNAIKDDDLFVAYCGWAWLFPPLQKGAIETKFTSSGEEARYLALKRKEGLTDIAVTERYKIGSTELTGFRAKRNGTPVQGAGDSQTEVVLPASDPRFNLPAIYFLLGQQVIQSVH